MKLNKKHIILLAVILVVGVIFTVPYLRPEKITKFAVTPKPAEKLEAAIRDGKPVYLEFYSPK